MSEGKLVVFSGGEGSGKTSTLNQLVREFPHLVSTWEPGGTPAGLRIRQLLLNDRTVEMNGLTELYLFTADRHEHVTKVIEPALKAGRTILTDRHWMDTFAYQWYATMNLRSRMEFSVRCVDPHWPKPHLWLWFDVDPATGLQRRRSTTEQNRIDDRDLAFHTRVHDGFKLVYGWYPDHKVRIDANQSPDEVYASVKAALGTMLES